MIPELLDQESRSPEPALSPDGEMGVAALYEESQVRLQ